MILHFVKRDFATHRLSWLMLTAITLLYFPARILEIDMFGALGYFYFIFPMVTLQQVAGVNWRSQHIMSRNYLLALPVSRTKMFGVVMIRALIFCIPAFVFCLIAPSYWEPVYEFFIISSELISMTLIVLFGFIWFVALAISMQIGIERITTYLTLQQRMWAWVKYFSFFILEALAFLSVIILLAELTPIWFPVVGSALFARIRFVLAREAWLSKR
jgi:hypothetical protein